MEQIINVMVRNKIAVADQTVYVCGNGDNGDDIEEKNGYALLFDFDEEWSKYEHKTARFKFNGKHIDVVFSGDKCPVPIISNTYGIDVGVYAGDLCTTTPAYIPAKKSILCGASAPDNPTPDIYHQIMALLNDLKEVSQEDVEKAVIEYMENNPGASATVENIAYALGYIPMSPGMTKQEIEIAAKGLVSLPKRDNGSSDHGTTGQIAVSDGKGGVTWETSHVEDNAFENDVSGEIPTDDMYFDIDAAGLVSLKKQYRGRSSSSDSFSISDNGQGKDGSANAELPEKIVIPEVINGRVVTGFQVGMFSYNYRVKEIVLPSSVYALPDRFARYAVNLEKLRNTRHITKLGFNIHGYTRVREAIYPNLRETAGAFAGCSYLRLADIGENITTIPKQMFTNCPVLTTVKGGSKVTEVVESAFYMTRALRELHFLPNLRSIGTKAFYCSGITYDWDTLKEQGCTFGSMATPIEDEEAQRKYWVGANPTACQNPLVTLLGSKNQPWTNVKIGSTGFTYEYGCTWFCMMHIHSAITGTPYSDPRDFVSYVGGINAKYLTNEGDPGDNLEKAVTCIKEIGAASGAYSIADGDFIDNGIVDTATLQKIYDALCDGAYIITEVSTANNVNNQHVVVLYGITENGEVLIANSDEPQNMYSPPGKLFRYSMPIQNLIGPASKMAIVRKW